MAFEKTFSIIKPDGVSRNLIGKILSRFEENGLRIVATKMIHMSKREAEGFYAVHSERSFFGELTEFMCSGPVVVSILEGENAVTHHREIMGQQILLKQLRVRFVGILLKVLGKTLSMVQTVWKTLPLKFLISSRKLSR